MREKARERELSGENIVNVVLTKSLTRKKSNCNMHILYHPNEIIVRGRYENTACVCMFDIRSPKGRQSQKFKSRLYMTLMRLETRYF